MSNWGLEVKNAAGFSNLNPDSFTVKLVESVWVGWEVLLPDTVIDIPTSPAVLQGMFGVITIYGGQLPVNHDMQTTFQGYNATGTPLSLPLVEIYNGMVRVRGQPLVSSRSTGMIVISIMQYL